jgi:hypothetical protein
MRGKNVGRHHKGVPMPRKTNVLIIRHGEKPDSGPGLSASGQARAQAYAVYFQNYAINSSPLKLGFLFAAADTPESHRSRLTLEPLARALGQEIDCEHRDHQEIVEDLLQDAEYNGSNVLVCWHHADILALAADLGVNTSALPPESNWPAVWPNEVFGWLLQVCYDEHGDISPSQTFCLNQRLMYGDHGQNPPVIG